MQISIPSVVKSG